MIDSFTKTYTDRAYRYPAMVRHKGTVIAFAMDDRRRIFYSVLDVANAVTARDSDAWLERPREVSFPREIADVGFAIADQVLLPIVRTGSAEPVDPGVPVADEEIDPFLSSTAQLTADAPFQVLSDGSAVYLFRQSTSAESESALVDGNLLADRFLLVGTELVPKREVRFQRSRSRTRPASNTDSLGAVDLEGRPFLEPTQVLGFITGLSEGRFAAVLIPTQVADVSRWQVFAVNAVTGLIDAYNLGRTPDGLFTTRPTADAEPPVVGGAAGAALRFSGDGDRIELEPRAVALGEHFTIEAWLKVATGTRGERTLLAGLAIVDGTRVKVGVGAGRRGRETVSGDILEPGTWQHLAVTYDGQRMRVYVEGVLRHRSDVLGETARPVPVERIGAPSGSFTGLLDELRLWRTARSAEAIKRAAGERLTGLEPDLAAYWRLDEGSGARVFDSVARGGAAPGRLAGPEWVTSDAPVADLRGLTRTSFSLHPRVAASAPTTLQYFQQERAASGYDGAPRRLKRAARVMLAVSTTEEGAGDEIVVLDFGVSVDGRLADLPTKLELARLDAPETGPGSTEERLRAVNELEARVSSLRRQVDGLERATAELAVLDPVLDDGADPLRLDLQGLDIVLIQDLWAFRDGRTLSPNPWAPPVVAARAAARSVVASAPALADARAALTATTAELATARTVLAGGIELQMPLLAIDRAGLSAAGGVLGFARSTEAPLLFDSAVGRVALYFRGDGDLFSVAGYDTLTGRTRLSLPAGRGALTFSARTANLGDGSPLSLRVEPGVSADTCTLTIALNAVTETWAQAPVDARGLADVLNGAAAVPALVGAAAAIDRRTDTVDFPDGTRAPVRAGALLRAGGQTATVREPAPAGATSIAIEPAELTLNAGTPVHAIAYDYATHARTTQVPGSVARGSLLVSAAADAATERVAPPAAATLQPAEAVCRWLTAPVGGALTFDGEGGRAALADPELSPGVAAASDLTVEAWVRPQWTPRLGKVVESQAQSPSFTLAARPVPGALRFTGARDALVVPANAALRIADRVTLEAWVSPQRLDGNRTIISRYQPGGSEAEVYLRISGRNYQIGCYASSGGDRLAQAPVPSQDLGAWVHLVGVHDGAAWRLYRNGVEIASAPDTRGVVAMATTAPWTIGSWNSGADRVFLGSIAEARIWSVPRSATQVARSELGRPPVGEAGLAGYWQATRPQLFRFTGPSDAVATLQGAPVGVRGARDGWTAVVDLQPSAQVPALALESAEVFPCERWTHLALVYRQGWGIQVAGLPGHLDCGTNTTLDIVGDLTIEAGVRLEGADTGHGIVSRAGGDAAAPGPYSLAVGADGRLHLSFTDGDGTIQTLLSDAAVPRPGFSRVAVTRRRGSTVDPPPASGAAQADASKAVRTWVDYAFYVDGKPAGVRRYTGPDPRSGSGPTRIGEAMLRDRTLGLHGTVTEVRVFNAARDASAIGARLNGSEPGLVAWWRFRENEGAVTADAKGSNHARFRGTLSWVRTPDPSGSTIELLRDGAPISTGPVAEPIVRGNRATLALGAGAAVDLQDAFRGQIAELRLWRTARTKEQIEDNLYRRLTGEKEDLIAHYPFDFEAPGRISDHSSRGNHVVTSGGVTLSPSTAPLGEDIPEVRDALLSMPSDFTGTIGSRPSVGEYAELQTDANGRLFGSFKRCYGVVDGGTWRLIAGQKVGDLSAEWIGQAQFAPQVIGYIEGAPPVPSENLTGNGSYAGASSVELTEADATTATFASSRDRGTDESIETALAVGLGDEVTTGFGVEKRLIAASFLIGARATFDTTLGWLNEAQTSQGTTVTSISSLSLRGSREDPEHPAHPALGARFVPENTGLALVQSETADVFALRLLHTGALVAYQMRPNPDIPKDWNIITFPIDPHYTKQGTLDGRVGAERDVDYRHVTGNGSSRSYFRPLEAYALKQRIAREEQRLKAQFAEYDAGAQGRRAGGGSDLGYGRLGDQLPRFAKRNLVNTYVWTAAGGLFAVEEQTLDSVSESTGGSFSFKQLAGLTVKADLEVLSFAASAELSALFGGHVELTVSKTEESQRSFELRSRAEPDADIGDRGADGRFVRHPGKVDAYRYMTFYLEPGSEHHDALFSQVIDPRWLGSDDPAAVALNQARQPGKRPACWRVMHRVTYVSRVLAPVGDEPAEPGLDQALQELDLDSNYELIRIVGPLVSDKRSDYAAFAAAVQEAVRTHLPRLAPHTPAIVSYLALYYDVSDNPGLVPGEDLSTLTAAPPAVHVPTTFKVAAGEPVELHGEVIDESANGGTLAVQWTKLEGPEDVKIDRPDTADTTAAFGEPGVYLLRLTAVKGPLSAYADTTVTATAAGG